MTVIEAMLQFGVRRVDVRVELLSDLTWRCRFLAADPSGKVAVGTLLAERVFQFFPEDLSALRLEAIPDEPPEDLPEETASLEESVKQRGSLPVSALRRGSPSYLLAWILHQKKPG